MNKNILLIFIGNVNTTESIGHYPDIPNNEQHIEAFKIFQKYSKDNLREYDRRYRVETKDGNFFFTINKKNIFYLVLATFGYSESSVFTLINMMIDLNLHLLIDEINYKLNSVGKESLRKLVNDFITKEPSTLETVTSMVRETKQEMGKYIGRMADCVDELHVLEERALRIKKTAKDYKKNANILKRVTCLHYWKWMALLIILFVSIVLLILLPFLYPKKKRKI